MFTIVQIVKGRRALIMKLTLLIFVFLGATPSIMAGKILFFMPVMPKSSTFTFLPLVHELVERGHQVTVVNAFGTKKEHPNLTVIKPKSVDLQAKMKEQTRFMLRENTTTLETILFTSNAMSHFMLKWPTLFNELDTDFDLFNKEKFQFDMVICYAMLTNELGFIMSHHFDAQLVLYTTVQSSINYLDELVGQPHNPAILPFLGTPFTHPMSFLERVGNTAIHIAFDAFRYLKYLPELESILDISFPQYKDTRPSILEMQNKVGLVLAYGHPLIQDGLRPTSPNYVTIGMMKCDPPPALPKDLQKFMDDAKDGVIFVSFGSVMQASEMSDAVRLKLTSVFKGLKQKILWKWETEEMKDKPSNVKLSKWLPQESILAHPNLRLFVTHGGQSSSQEALCHKKPTVVIPIFGDQPSNALEAQRRGYGISIPFPQLTAEKLSNAINTILTDPSYTKRAIEHGTLVVDEMVKPLDRGVWWIEYALKYPGLPHMRSPVHDLNFVQYFLLDVIAFLVGIIALIVFITLQICKCCCCKKSSQKTKTE